MSQVLETVGMILGGGFAGSAGTAVFHRRRNRAEVSKIDADAAQVIAETAVTLVAPLQAQITALNERVGTLETENESTKAELAAHKTLFGIALGHIRELHRWIDQHVPGRDRPQPPSELGL